MGAKTMLTPRPPALTDAEPTTLDELLTAAFIVQVHDEQDLAFVCDAAGDLIVATVESPYRDLLLPPLPYSPARCWRLFHGEDGRMDRYLESAQPPRQLALWLNRCRDTGAVLTVGGADLWHWWDDGRQRLTADDVLRMLE